MPVQRVAVAPKWMARRLLYKSTGRHVTRAQQGLPAPQRIVRERRQYTPWVARQTLEDYALRYTAASARKSSFRVGNTALGPIAFLACEAIGGTITIAYGFPNAVWAIVAFMALMFLIGLPIAYYAAKYG